MLLPEVELPRWRRLLLAVLLLQLMGIFVSLEALPCWPSHVSAASLRVQGSTPPTSRAK